MMHIGITIYPEKPLEQSGANQTALLLGEQLTALGHSVAFLYQGVDAWWDTIPMPPQTTSLSLRSAKKEGRLDGVIDVDGTLYAEDRPLLSPKTVVFLRTFLQFAEMDTSVYIENPYRHRSMDHVVEVWCWDILNPPETIPSIQTMFPCPIRRVPFIWSPTLTTFFTGGKQADAPASPKTHWTIHVAEKNTNESTPVLPLVAIREIVNKGVIPATYHLHHMESVQDNRFFKENVAANIELDTLPVQLHPERTPFSCFLKDLNPLFLSHSRFTPLRTCLLQVIWMGIPVLHNSRVLRDLHPTLAALYYEGNEIRQMTERLRVFHENHGEWYRAHESRQEAIRSSFGLSVHTEAWSGLFSCMAALPALPALPVTPVTPLTSALPVTPVTPVTPLTSALPALPVISAITLVFSDFWEGFNEKTNFLTDTLRHFYPTLSVEGLSYSSFVPNGSPCILMIGPFGNAWKTASPTLPRVFFTAENWPLEDDPSIALYLTSSVEEDDRHFRIPTWMTFIDWFSGSTTLPSHSTDNPIRIPLHFATTPHPVSFHQRKEFCAFVVSNPINPLRNDAFQRLSQYKKVTSGGALFNNIGGQLDLLYMGGGAGDLSKHEFFSWHRFVLSFENSQAAGYITEKVLHAKMAGCVPLYWGDSDTDKDFAPGAIVNLSFLTSATAIVDIVKKLESSPERCEAIAATPLLNQEKTENAIRLLRRMCERLIGVASAKSSPPLRGITATYVINLDRRKDRWETLLQAEPSLSTFATRISAVDGKTLSLTPPIVELFRKSDCQWRKGVIGCALSHMMVWSRIQKESPPYALILEDDVRFQTGWQEKWNESFLHIPADADLLYLGGVLPPNKPALPSVLEAVNSHWARIRPNTLFSSVPVPVFHFCAYSYVLTPSGTKKLMNHLRYSDLKYHAACDHLLGSPILQLTKYVMTPLVAHCFQENDPVYLHSQFNDIQRKDTFDSDLWNNTDCFDPERDVILSAPPASAPAPPASPVSASPAPSASLDPPSAPAPSASPLAPLAPPASLDPPVLPVYYMATDTTTPPEIYEQLWLEDILQVRITWKPIISIKDGTPPADSWFLVQRPHSAKWSKWFHHFQRMNLTFKILHLSDEFATDNIQCYTLPNCKGILRTYVRPDLPVLPHLVTLPLGYHHRSEAHPAFSKRPIVWSFHGTNWFQRAEQLMPFHALQPNDCRLQPEWKHATATPKEEYLLSLQQSQYCPILKGNHLETFRFYEALEAGSLPVTTITDKDYLGVIEKEMGLSTLYGWEDPMRTMKGNISDELQDKVYQRWTSWKERLRAQVKQANFTADPSS